MLPIGLVGDTVVLVLKGPFLYLIRATKCKSSDAGTLDMPQRSRGMLVLCQVVSGSQVLRNDAYVIHLTSSHHVGIRSPHSMTRRVSIVN